MSQSCNQFRVAKENDTLVILHSEEIHPDELLRKNDKILGKLGVKISRRLGQRKLFCIGRNGQIKELKHHQGRFIGAAICRFRKQLTLMNLLTTTPA